MSNSFGVVNFVVDPSVGGDRSRVEREVVEYQKLLVSDTVSHSVGFFVVSTGFLFAAVSVLSGFRDVNGVNADLYAVLMVAGFLVSVGLGVRDLAALGRRMRLRRLAVVYRDRVVTTQDFSVAQQRRFDALMDAARGQGLGSVAYEQVWEYASWARAVVMEQRTRQVLEQKQEALLEAEFEKARRQAELSAMAEIERS